MAERLADRYDQGKTRRYGWKEKSLAQFPLKSLFSINKRDMKAEL